LSCFIQGYCYFLNDNLTVDIYNGDAVVDSFDIEDADVNW